MKFAGLSQKVRPTVGSDTLVTTNNPGNDGHFYYMVSYWPHKAREMPAQVFVEWDVLLLILSAVPAEGNFSSSHFLFQFSKVSSSLD